VSALVGRHPLKARYYRNIRNAMIAATLIHGVAFAVAPPYQPRPFQMKVDIMRVVDAVAPALGGGQAAGAPAPPSGNAPPPQERVVADRAIRTVEGAAVLPEPATAGGSGEGGGSTGAITDEAPPVFYSYDKAPNAVRRVEPEYPAAAREMGAEGTVVINLNLDERGKIIRAWVAAASANEILINAALEAAYLFEFQPGMQRETPVKCTVAIPFQFILRKGVGQTEGR
jgi:protein TonB